VTGGVTTGTGGAGAKVAAGLGEAGLGLGEGEMTTLATGFETIEEEVEAISDDETARRGGVLSRS